MQYFRFRCEKTSVDARASVFQMSEGASECHLMLAAHSQQSVRDQIEAIEVAYAGMLNQLGISIESTVWRRFFTSDLVNQRPVLEESAVCRPDGPSPCAISFVEQAPMPDRKVVMWAYHVSGAEQCKSLAADGALTLERNGVRHVLVTGLTDAEHESSYEQTQVVFRGLDTMLANRGMTLADHVLRTWIYVQNVDANYAGLVRARREHFEASGLTKDTHFIASTGIEGRYDDPRVKVLMDVYCVEGIRAEQIEHIEARDHLNPTHEYGVTFERATAIQYGDRRHVIVSGTASIDNQGRILHEGDVRAQLDRTLENIQMLLASARASFADVTHFIVYLRDHGDHAVAREEMRQRFGEVPLLVVMGPVCRPGWLIEVECIAVTAETHPEYADF